MLQRIWPRLLAALAACLLTASALAAQDESDFLPPEQAFELDAAMAAPDTLELRYRVAPGYYLYRERFVLTPAEGQARWLGEPVYPKGEVKHDPTFDKDMEVYHHDLVIRVPLVSGAPGPLSLTVTSQGCAEAGLCYPPMDKTLTLVPLNAGYDVGGPCADCLTGATSTPAGRSSAASLTAAASPARALPGVASGSSSSGLGSLLAAGDVGLARALSGLSGLTTIGVFLLLGLLLSLTPCVLPMIPILSSVVLGAAGPHTRRRGLGLAAAYVLGVSVVYTALGVAAGLTGMGLAAWMQTPWVLGMFAAVLVVLALSMFGVFTFQMPASAQSWLSARLRGIPGGHATGAALMGAISALVVGPCVAAPLAGALLYISQTGDVAMGGAALFALAWGMGVPLLLVGASAGTLLPRVGPWMTVVNRVFGVLLLVTAWWILSPVLPSLRSPQPSVGAQAGQVEFRRVRSLADLDAALAASNKPAMLDFYADWCVSCREMEQYTFSDPDVARRMQGMLLLQADVTKNNEDDRALLKRFRLFGPPGIMFFAPGGRELDVRVIGFQNTKRFGQSLDAVDAASARGSD